MKLPFPEHVVAELMKNNGFTLKELEKDYRRFMLEEETIDGEFTEDWTKPQ